MMERSATIEVRPNPYVLPSVSEIYSDRSWFRSNIDDRYLLLRGVCFGPIAKVSPYLSLLEESDWQRFESQIDLLFDCGFRALRFAFSWEGLEPEFNPDGPKYNKIYADRFFAILEQFAVKGFTIFIDIHQDLVQKAFGGNGFPDWVFEDGSKRGVMFANTPWWGLNYAFNRGLRKTFTAFWKNDLSNRRNAPPIEHFKIRDRFLDMIEYVAMRASSNSAILGIEIINEPHQALFDPAEFEGKILSEFYEQAIDRIRKHSSSLYAFLAPFSEWNVSATHRSDYESKLDIKSADDRLVFAYHFYDSMLTGLHGLHFHPAKRQEYREAIYAGVREARRRNMVPFLTEYGSRQNWLSSILRRHMSWNFEASELAAVNSTYWNVNFYNTKRRHDGFMKEDFSLIDWDLTARNLDIATRPYPLASGMEPVSIHYELSTRLARLEFKEETQSTFLYLPSAINHAMQPAPYERGFQVWANGGEPMENVVFDPNTNLLEIKIGSGRPKNELTIVPTDKLPFNNGEVYTYIPA